MNAESRESLFSLGHGQRLQLYWVRHRWIDIALALSVTLLWLACGWKGYLPLAITEVGAAQRQTIYQIVATLAGTMGGFVLTSVSILVNLLRTPMTAIDRLLPADDKRKVGDVVINVLPVLGVLFAVAVTGILLDSTLGQGIWWIEALLATSLLSTLLALSRVFWVLRRLLMASST